MFADRVSGYALSTIVGVFIGLAGALTVIALDSPGEARAPAGEVAPITPASSTEGEVKRTDLGSMTQGEGHEKAILHYSKEEFPDGSYRYCTVTVSTGGNGGNVGGISCTELLGTVE